jgi:alanine dehydrogenase
VNICVPKERYPLEKRVMVTPSTAQKIIEEGHSVFVESGAGAGVHIEDKAYMASGAIVITDVQELYKKADLIVKLKSPSPEEYSLINECILFSMFHSQQNPENIYYAGLQDLVVVELEQVVDQKKERLINQTHVTGEVGVHYAMNHSDKMPWDMRALVLGYGNVSTGAVFACDRLGIRKKILRKSEFRYIKEHLAGIDLLINGLAWPESARKKREYVVTRTDIQNSPRGMIVLDLSVDFPNPIETVRPTTYRQPFYLEEGHVHISLYGYPGLKPVTSTRIYSQQVLPLILTVANNDGLEGIGRQGELGRAIKKAVLDPNDHNWEQYKPNEEITGSKIE